MTNSRKPDLSSKVTIRLGKDVHKRIKGVCEDEVLDEAFVLRTILEAGLQVAEELGIEGVMSKRRTILKKLRKQ